MIFDVFVCLFNSHKKDRLPIDASCFSSNGPRRSNPSARLPPSKVVNGFVLVDEDDDDYGADFYNRPPKQYEPPPSAASRRTTNGRPSGNLAKMAMPPLMRAPPRFTRRPPDLTPINQQSLFFSTASDRSSYGLVADVADRTIGSAHRMGSNTESTGRWSSLGGAAAPVAEAEREDSEWPEWGLDWPAPCAEAESSKSSIYSEKVKTGDWAKIFQANNERRVEKVRGCVAGLFCFWVQCNIENNV